MNGPSSHTAQPPLAEVLSVAHGDVWVPYPLGRLERHVVVHVGFSQELDKIPHQGERGYGGEEEQDGDERAPGDPGPDPQAPLEAVGRGGVAEFDKCRKIRI